MRILIHNQKGGVGKTTTAANLGAALLRAGAGRVVLADLDPQMHLTAALGIAPGMTDWTVADWLAGRPGAPRALAEGMGLIAGHPQPLAMAAVPETDADWLLIDAAPAWTAQTAALMAACDIVLCPLEPDFLGLHGVSRLLRQMDEAGVPRSRLRLLVTRFNARLALHRQARARLTESFGASVLPVAIRNSVKLAEAPGQGVTVFAHAPDSSGAADHLALAAALMPPAQGCLHA